MITINDVIITINDVIKCLTKWGKSPHSHKTSMSPSIHITLDYFPPLEFTCTMTMETKYAVWQLYSSDFLWSYPHSCPYESSKSLIAEIKEDGFGFNVYMFNQITNFKPSDIQGGKTIHPRPRKMLKTPRMPKTLLCIHSREHLIKVHWPTPTKW